MDTVRHVFGFLLVALIPPALLFWFLVHPFIAFWRRLGPRVTYAVMFTVMLVVAAGLGVVHRRLLGPDFGLSWPLLALGVVCLGISIRIWTLRRKHLTDRILMGLPELAPEATENRLLTEGIYSRVRNPRYVEVIAGVLGYALIANYLGGYVVVVLTVAAIWLIVLLEERELRERFGATYDDYTRRVPRFIPRRG